MRLDSKISRRRFLHATVLTSSAIRSSSSDAAAPSNRVTVGVKSRKACVAPAEAAHRAITPGHLGFVSNEVGKPLRWDANRETIVGNADTQEKLITVNYRTPWRLPD